MAALLLERAPMYKPGGMDITAALLMGGGFRQRYRGARLLVPWGRRVHRDTFGDPAINWAAYYGIFLYPPVA